MRMPIQLLCLFSLFSLTGLVGCGDGSYTATCRFQKRSDVGFLEDHDDRNDLVASVAERLDALMDYEFTGRPALAQLIADMDELNHDLPLTDDHQLTEEGRVKRDALIEKLTKAIRVHKEVNVEGLELVSVNVTLDDGELAAKVANKLAMNYVKKVRAQVDATLINQKQFFHQEATRYRRVLAGLEARRVRFRESALGGDVDLEQGMENPEATHLALKEGPRKAQAHHAELTAKIKYLTELYGDKPIGDRSAIQLAEWKAERDQADAEVKQWAARKEKMEVFNRRFFEVRNEWLKIQRETAEAEKQLGFWDKNLRSIQLALTMAVSDRGMRMSIVELASPPPVKPKTKSSPSGNSTY